MSRKLVLQIANSQLAEAKETLNEALVEIMAAKLHEKKKMIAAGAINESKSTTVSSGFPSFKRNNPKGLAEGKNPDRNLSDAGKKDNIHNLRVSASDEDAKTSRTLEKIADARERAMKKKSIKEAKSAKDAAAAAVKLVSDRTKDNERARLARKKVGYSDRDSDTKNLHDKDGESFGDWKKRKGKE